MPAGVTIAANQPVDIERQNGVSVYSTDLTSHGKEIKIGVDNAGKKVVMNDANGD